MLARSFMLCPHGSHRSMRDPAVFACSRAAYEFRNRCDIVVYACKTLTVSCHACSMRKGVGILKHTFADLACRTSLHHVVKIPFMLHIATYSCG